MDEREREAESVSRKQKFVPVIESVRRERPVPDFVQYSEEGNNSKLCFCFFIRTVFHVNDLGI